MIIKNIFLAALFFCSCVFGDSIKEKSRVLFIVNPISHEIKGCNVQRIIEKNLDPHKFEYTIVYTQSAQHATKLAHKAILDSADIIAAVGGDGTVNEVGRVLIDTDTALAIIPVGSGNGLARHLGIPVGLTQGIKALNYAKPMVIDTAKINDKTFLGVAGIGFDAHIAQEFAHFGKRGFFSYGQLALKEFARYEPQYYLMTIDGKLVVKKAFILSFANSSQYGNDFFIAPHARINDGYLDLVIVDDIPRHSVPKFLYNFKQNTLDHSRHFETHRFKELTIEHPYMQAHVDGEPILFQNHITITIQPDSLKVMVP